MAQNTDASTLALLACEEGFDPTEDRLCANIRSTIEAVFNEELNGFLGRLRYGWEAGAVKGYRHGNQDRQIIGTFGPETIRVRRARITDEAGKVGEWRSKALPRFQRQTGTARAMTASVYLSGGNTLRVIRRDGLLLRWSAPPSARSSAGTICCSETGQTAQPHRTFASAAEHWEHMNSAVFFHGVVLALFLGKNDDCCSQDLLGLRQIAIMTVIDQF